MSTSAATGRYRFAVWIWLGGLGLVLGLSAQADVTSGRLPLRMAFPSVGTLISGQVGSVLQHTGLLAAHGFDAQINPLPLGKELKSAMIAGQTDLIFTSEANFLVLLGEGFDCYAISSLGTGGSMALVVKPGSAIHRVSDLRGKRVATIFGTSMHEPAVEWLKADGLLPGRDVTLMNMRGIGPMNSAFATGELDALLTFDPYLLAGVQKGEYRILKSTDLDLVVVISATYARAHPEAISAFNATLREAAFYMATHKSEVNGWASRLSGMPTAILAEGSRANANYNARSAAEIKIEISARFREKLARLNEFLFQEKLIQRKVTVADYIKGASTPP